MLKLVNITKEYKVGDTKVQALRGISLEFRKNEFVSILGPSGCGKTTTLNIIGGLDRYTSGDLIINGRSTKQYKDRDWDTYRNHSIGFVFQSYNLISHQTVLANVELALTLAGVSKSERRRRAIAALEQVGLGDQLNKIPSQMSGGQMQRVAIARALINDPDILLADEPTGALDSETSVAVMELLKEVAKDRLVIMVTHNPELAETYSTRIVKLKDGQVIGDSNPYHAEEEQPILTGRQAKSKKKTSMSFFTALSLSLTNLRTKKGRTVLTSFAGSIGIIGIALILALSTGINDYINMVQEETLSSYPIQIQAETTDVSSLMVNFMQARQEAWSEPREPDRVYSSTVMFDMMNSMVNAEVETNNLEAFRTYLENGGGGIKDIAYIDYDYDFDFDFYTTDEDGVIIKCDVMSLMESAMSSMFGGNYSSYFSSSMGSMYSRMNVWEELLSGEDDLVSDQVKDEYEMLYGTWPQNYDEVVIFVSPSNEISDLMLYSMGLMPMDDMESVMQDMMNGEDVGTDTRSWSFDELANLKFKLILPAEYYQYDAATGTYTDMSATDAGMDYLYNSAEIGLPIKVVGIARPLPDANVSSAGSIGYTSALTHWAIQNTAETEIMKKQLDDPTIDVFNGLPFPTDDDVEPTDEEKFAAIKEYLSDLSVSEKADIYIDLMSQPSDDYVNGIVEQQTADMTRESIEEMITQQYADEMGVDTETLTSYIADMTDEELFDRVEDAIAQAIRQQYAETVSAQLTALPQDTLADMLQAALDAEPAEEGEETDPEESAPVESTTPDAETTDAPEAGTGTIPGMGDGTDIPGTGDGTGIPGMDGTAGIPGMGDGTDIPGTGAGDGSGIPGMDGTAGIPNMGDGTGYPGMDGSTVPGMDGTAGIPNMGDGSTIPGMDGTGYPGMGDGTGAGYPGMGDGTGMGAGMAGMMPGMGEPTALEDWQLLFLYDNYMPPTISDSTYDENLNTLAYVREEFPSMISIYATTFAEKDEIADLITEYNNGVAEEDQISYTDYVALLMSSITGIISGISYLLIAFVSISLVVSSIMIGIITNISVLERTKEIGILRAVGASKRDISRVFNAETLIVGLAAGLLGILVSYLATFPINAIIHHVTDLEDLVAKIPPVAGVILVVISVVLTVIAGLVPSRSAARKDPVEALRSE